MKSMHGSYPALIGSGLSPGSPCRAKQSFRCRNKLIFKIMGKS